MKKVIYIGGKSVHPCLANPPRLTIGREYFIAGETYLVVKNDTQYFRPGSSSNKDDNYYHIYLTKENAKENNFGYAYAYKRECFVTLQEYRNKKLNDIGI
jgi:hypothetical protein